MSHHPDLADKAQIRPRKTEIVTTIFLFFYLYSLKSMCPSSVQQYVQVEVAEAEGNTFALMQ